MKYLFKNGTVVSGRGTRRADVLVEDEIILQYGARATVPMGEFWVETDDRSRFESCNIYRSRRYFPAECCRLRRIVYGAVRSL